MNTYRVTVEETFSDIYAVDYIIEADSEEDALNNYLDGEVVESELLEQYFDDREGTHILNITKIE